MIDKKEYHKERSKLSGFIPKPGTHHWGFMDSGNPEQMGLFQKQRGGSNKQSKKKKR